MKSSKYFYIVMAAMCLLPGITYSAEFTWFADVRGREGWIEFNAEPIDFQNRIHVFPRIGGPEDPDGAPIVSARNNGAVVTVLIDSTPPGDTQSFVYDVLAKVVSQPSNVSPQYQLNIPRPRGVRINILQDGSLVATRTIQGRIPSEHVVQIHVPANGASKAAILRGEFQVEASFELPTAIFSSVSINVKESLVARYKIQALKSVVKRSRTSGGKFLFFDWRRKTAQTIIRQSINEQRSVRASRRTSVLTIDPDNQMISRIEQMLGLAPLSREKFVTNHLKAADQAEAAGNYELAALHREYALKADDPTPKVQTELLEKAFAALGSSEPAIGAFLANGIQFSEGSTTSSSRFQGFGQTRTDFFSENGYSEMRLTTSMVRYVLAAGPFASDDAHIRAWFGTATPNQQAATRGLLRAVESNNVPMALAALRFSAGSNASYGLQGSTPLIMAAQRCNATIVKALLDAGANPYLRDGNHRSAAYYSKVAGCGEISDLIRSYQ